MLPQCWGYTEQQEMEAYFRMSHNELETLKPLSIDCKGYHIMEYKKQC